MHTAAKISDDQNIQNAVQEELRWTPDVDAPRVAVMVEDAVVTLSGEVAGCSELLAAERAVQHLRGVAAVDNRVGLTARPSAVEAEARIKNALARNAQLDAGRTK